MSYTDEYVRNLEKSYAKDMAELIAERDEWKARALKAEGLIEKGSNDPRQIRHV